MKGFLYLKICISKRRSYLRNVAGRLPYRDKGDKQTINGADLLINALNKENVEVIFGYPGGAVLTDL